MTKKELQKLNRYQLLELLVMQTEQNQQLQQQVEQLQVQLQTRHLQMEQLGSIAEASLQLQGVFEAAQRAADAYLDAARCQAAKIVDDARAQAERQNGETDEV